MIRSFFNKNTRPTSSRKLQPGYKAIMPFWKLASSLGILLYPAAACLVTQSFFFKMADGKVYQGKDKVTAPPTVPTKGAEELTGDEARIQQFNNMCSTLPGNSVRQNFGFIW